MTPRKRLDHEMPYWVDAVPDYFLTICADPRGQNHLCRPDIGPAVLESIKVYNEKGNWHCEVAVLMPDHLHLLVSIPPDKILSKVVGLWKRALAKSHKISWQRNFFDHRLRSDATHNSNQIMFSKIRFVRD